MDPHGFCWLLFACAQAIVIPYRYSDRPTEKSGNPVLLSFDEHTRLRPLIEHCQFPYIDTMVESLVALRALSRTANVSLMYVPADLWNLYLISRVYQGFRDPGTALRNPFNLDVFVATHSHKDVSFVETKAQRDFLKLVVKAGFQLDQKRTLRQLSLKECDRIVYDMIFPILKRKAYFGLSDFYSPLHIAFKLLVADLKKGGNGLIAQAIEAESAIINRMENLVWRSTSKAILSCQEQSYTFEILANYAKTANLGVDIHKSPMPSEESGKVKYHYSLLSGFMEFDGEVTADTCPFIVKAAREDSVIAYSLALDNFSIWNAKTYTTFPLRNTSLDVFSGSSSKKIVIEPCPELAMQAERFIAEHARSLATTEKEKLEPVLGSMFLHDVVDELIAQTAMKSDTDLARPIFTYCFNLIGALEKQPISKEITAQDTARLVFQHKITRDCLNNAHTKAVSYANETFRKLITSLTGYDKTVLETVQGCSSSDKFAPFLSDFQKELDYLANGGEGMIFSKPHIMFSYPEPETIGLTIESDNGVEANDDLDDLLGNLYSKWALEKFVDRLKYMAAVDCGAILSSADSAPKDTITPWKVALLTFTSSLIKESVPQPSDIDERYDIYSKPYPQEPWEEIEYYCYEMTLCRFDISSSNVDSAVMTTTFELPDILEELYVDFPKSIQGFTKGRIFVLAFSFLGKIAAYMGDEHYPDGRDGIKLRNAADPFLIRERRYREYNELSFHWSFLVLPVVVGIAMAYRGYLIMKKAKQQQERMEALPKFLTQPGTPSPPTIHN